MYHDFSTRKTGKVLSQKLGSDVIYEGTRWLSYRPIFHATATLAPDRISPTIRLMAQLVPITAVLDTL